MKLGNKKRFDWLQVLIDLKMAKSKSEAQRLFKQKAIKVEVLDERHVLVRKGTQVGTIDFE